MINHLKSGWFTRRGQQHLRSEVINGAIDAASALYRAGVPVHTLTELALNVRTLANIVQPPHRLEHSDAPDFPPTERERFMQRLRPLIQRYGALEEFVTLCIEHVHNVVELRAFYLHLVHVGQMLHLLAAAASAGFPEQPSASPARTPKKKSGATRPRQTRATASRKRR